MLPTYVLRGGLAGAERLGLLARVTWPTTEPLLQSVGLAEGMRCLDAGCGIGAVTCELARRVGPAGQAVGIDLDGSALEEASAEAERQGLHADFRAVGVVDLADESAFDLVYARFLLSHLPAADQGAERLVRAAVPGGLVVVEDTDFDGHFCHPHCPAFVRYVSLYREAVRRKGGDACIGPRLPEILERAGLREVQLRVAQPAFRGGEGKSLAAVTLEHVRDSLAALGLCSTAEVDEMLGELREFAAAPGTILSLPRIFQVWGRKPGRE